MNDIHNKANNAATYPWVSNPKIASQAYEHTIIPLLQSDIITMNNTKSTTNNSNYRNHSYIAMWLQPYIILYIIVI